MKICGFPHTYVNVIISINFNVCEVVFAHLFTRREIIIIKVGGVRANKLWCDIYTHIFSQLKSERKDGKLVSSFKRSSLWTRLRKTFRETAVGTYHGFYNFCIGSSGKLCKSISVKDLVKGIASTTGKVQLCWILFIADKTNICFLCDGLKTAQGFQSYSFSNRYFIYFNKFSSNSGASYNI